MPSKYKSMCRGTCFFFQIFCLSVTLSVGDKKFYHLGVHFICNIGFTDYTLTLLIRCFGSCYLQHDSAFHAFLEKNTSVFVSTVDVTCCMICICGTTSGAVQFCPAIFTFFFCVCIAKLKLLSQTGICHAFPYIAHAVSGVGYELMTGEQLSPRCYCKIFSAGTASG